MQIWWNTSVNWDSISHERTITCYIFPSKSPANVQRKVCPDGLVRGDVENGGVVVEPARWEDHVVRRPGHDEGHLQKYIRFLIVRPKLIELHVQNVDRIAFYVNMPSAICGQSYKASTLVIYDSRVVPDLKIPHITTLEL